MEPPAPPLVGPSLIYYYYVVGSKSGRTMEPGVALADFVYLFLIRVLGTSRAIRILVPSTLDRRAALGALRGANI